MYSVDGWNTDDNIVPQWTGHTLHEVAGIKEAQCGAGVWPLFSKRGYVTANLASYDWVTKEYSIGSTECPPDAEMSQYLYETYYDEGNLSPNQCPHRSPY